MERLTVLEFARALLTELKTAVDSLGGGAARFEEGPVGHGSGWVVEIRLGGRLRGLLDLWIDGPGVEALAKVVLGSEAETTPESLADLLREMFSQATSAVAAKPPCIGTEASVGDIKPDVQRDKSDGFIVHWTDDATAQVIVSGTLEEQEEAVPAPADEGGNNLDVVLDIELPLTVRFGSTEMSIKALSALGPGSIVDMGRSPDDPVHVLVGDRVIARAEVVIVGGNYGVRITDLINPTDRFREAEA